MQGVKTHPCICRNGLQFYFYIRYIDAIAHVSSYTVIVNQEVPKPKDTRAFHSNSSETKHCVVRGTD